MKITVIAMSTAILLAQASAMPCSAGNSSCPSGLLGEEADESLTLLQHKVQKDSDTATQFCPSVLNPQIGIFCGTDANCCGGICGGPTSVCCKDSNGYGIVGSEGSKCCTGKTGGVVLCAPNSVCCGGICGGPDSVCCEDSNGYGIVGAPGSTCCPGVNGGVIICAAGMKCSTDTGLCVIG